MKDLFLIYTGALFSATIAHNLISDLLALTTITYTIVKLYTIYQDYKNQKK
jgi:hypothetical protein